MVLNNEISDHVASRIDFAKLHDRYARHPFPDMNGSLIYFECITSYSSRSLERRLSMTLGEKE